MKRPHNVHIVFDVGSGLWRPYRLRVRDTISQLRGTYRRGRRDKVACRSCCDTYAGGRYDRRFRLVVVPRAE